MDSVEIKKLEGAIEAILFTMGDSVELSKIAAAVEHDENTVRKIIHQMMDKYEAEDRGALLSSPALYALTQGHKHLPEMQIRCGLSCPPVFSPIVDDYYKGMATTVPLHMSQLRGVRSLHQVWQALADYYGTYDGKRLVYVAGDPTDPEGGIDAASKFYGGAKAGDNDLVLTVAGNDSQLTVTSLFDNLGKGASGAAVQNMNLMLGFEETEGLL